MIANDLRRATSIAIWFSYVVVSGAFAAAPDSVLLQAKREAEAKGYIFAASHD